MNNITRLDFPKMVKCPYCESKHPVTYLYQGMDVICCVCAPKDCISFVGNGQVVLPHLAYLELLGGSME